MPKNSDGLDLQKHTLWLFAGDYERLGSIIPSVPPAIALRKILRDFIERTEGEKPKDVKVDF